MTDSEKVKLLSDFIQTHFKYHYVCEDNFYGCPKSEGYFGTDLTDVCYCGKDKADTLLKSIKD